MNHQLYSMLFLAAAAGCQGAQATGPAEVPPVTAPPSSSAAPAPLVLPPPEDPAPSVAACQAGDMAACARAATLYYEGWGVARDMTLVGRYGGMACKGGVAEACALKELADLDGFMPSLSPGLASYKAYVKSFESEGGPPWCTQLKGTDRWGYAAYYASNCHLAEAQATLQPTSVPEGFEQAAVEAACFERAEREACRGMTLVSRPGEVDGKKLAPLCRKHNIGCDGAEGDTPAETFEFRKKACLAKEYMACLGWLRVAPEPGFHFDQLDADRIFAQVCLHPVGGGVPMSVHVRKRGEASICAIEQFKALAASSEPGDRVLFAGLSRMPKEADAEETTAPEDQGAP